MDVLRYGFSFDPAARLLLLGLGVTPPRAWAELGDDTLRIRFGFWRWAIPFEQVAEVRLSGPYRIWKALGARVSFADGGLTLGTSTARGICLLFHQPIAGIAPLPVRHPGLTMTLQDAGEAAAAIAGRAGLPPPG